ncbi:neuropeptide FF receptor 2-like [Saccoglossus kowalevskii]|uniref:Neuropeptide FF receptor 2-like n=1 Tax=Saccoglossus kowalevskii TaxID=10224 RepID=A0ABM0H1B3_SACKO|nr:PREDICTED: neuropeptide FF receptor 2-like [Saccoglossus kowalevskii]
MARIIVVDELGLDKLADGSGKRLTEGPPLSMENMNNTFNWQDMYYPRRIIDVPNSYEIFVYCLFFVMIVFGNIWVIIAVLRQPKLRQSSTNMFILSLSVADILVAMFQIPYNLFYYLIPGVFASLTNNIFVCRTFAWFQWTSRCATVFSLIGIAIDRYRAIVTPLQPRLTRSHAGGIVAMIWTASLAYSLRKPILLDMYLFTWYNVTEKYCMVPFEYHSITHLLHIADFLVMYLVPLVIMVVLYCIMVVSLRKKGPTNTSNRNKRKAIKMLMLVVLAFALTWLPYYVYILYYNFTDKIPVSLLESVEVQLHIATFTYISNSWTNPCLYAYFNENFRKEFYRMLPCLENCCSKSNKIVPATSTKDSNASSMLQTRSTTQAANSNVK